MFAVEAVPEPVRESLIATMDAKELVAAAETLEADEIADLAETFEVNCAPHNFYGHMSTLMSAHFCAASLSVALSLTGPRPTSQRNMLSRARVSSS